MGIAADPADLVTADAQALAGTVVAARTRGRIAPRLAAMGIVAGRRTDPAGRMRAAPRIAGDAERGVAARAAVGRVTRRARTGFGARFERVARHETGAMDRRRHGVREVRRGRQDRDALAVAVGAEPVAMTRLTQIAGRCGARAVLAQPVAVVREVGRGQGRGVFEIAVTRVASTRVARGLVIVTTEAGRHRRTQVLIAFRDADVAPHAIAAARRGVRGVVEHQVCARIGELGLRVGGGVAAEAGVRVVRRGVTADAALIVGDVQRVAIVEVEPGVTPRAGDPGDRVRAMREWLRPRA